MKAQRLQPFLLVFALAWASFAAAGPAEQFDRGLLAAEQGDYQHAIQYWAPLALAGDAAAQFNLGLLLHSGAGGKQDEKAALEWYRRAAENGHPLAQSYLAAGYQEGWFGLPKDPERARYWEQRLGH